MHFERGIMHFEREIMHFEREIMHFERENGPKSTLFGGHKSGIHWIETTSGSKRGSKMTKNGVSGFPKCAEFQISQNVCGSCHLFFPI